ncbi:PREDICTED: ABC transporter G family member 23-like [Vollenhovia emeryi]|uniref:ABC transporter G family member 23-like n=1 Tax=Vollenhovia emeryi TaxID=411798 RepID=UPI0005F4F5C6|nr:PREDICTED: ABC transporter G family member 23-like [Vollenhovia emeryi]
MLQHNTVVVKNAMKRYGKEELVLDGLNMTVSNGSIYALLGASGCGKTTLLSCIVGVHDLDSGVVCVLGGSPGSMGCGIPGPRVGYMPQDTSLVELFSTSDALHYFGRINGLDDKEIVYPCYFQETRHRFFSELFQLPPSNQLVKNMSGGQRRRVSFVAALMHKPELLILDEPTVGLDPILRENIWAYLIKQTQEEGTTVLITTHYIEEAKKANKYLFCSSPYRMKP